MSRFVLGGLALTLALGGCARPTTPLADVEARDLPDGTTFVVVHGDFVGVDSVRVMPVRQLTRGSPASTDGSAAALVRPHAQGLAAPCPTGIACLLAWREPGGAVRAALVFAMEPRVEVALDPSRPSAHLFHVAYPDPVSTSAALGVIAENARALAIACEDVDAGAREAARARQSQILQTARTDKRALVRGVAWLALAEGRCVPTPDDAEITAATLAIDPSARAIALWPAGLAIEGDRAREEGGIAIVAAASERQPDPEAGAMLWRTLAKEALERGDETAHARAMARLAAPPFDRTKTSQVARTLETRRTRFRLANGDIFPDLALSVLGREAQLSTTELRGAPTLYYITSLACGSCKTNLPNLRTFAATHEDVSIVILVMDEDPHAPAHLAEKHAPIPGTIAWPDETARHTIDSAIMSPLVFPSFILTDAAGRVAATSLTSQLHEFDPQGL
jgi:hypothetical protein